jgi:membrane associated rhomboid family serine protease
MERLRPIITFIIIIWVIQFANFALGYRPNIWFGLEPRDFGGLVGIPLSPLLHGGFMHAAANTVPLLILGGMAAMAAPKRFIEATLIIVLVGGALVWLMARGGNRVHVGASGLVFGYFGFIMALGVVERSFRAILAAAAAAMLYGGLIMGIFPGNPQVSWESHLFGALAGAAAAWMLRSDKGATPHVT